MTKPLVSIVMVTYGQEKHIVNAINGVLLQEYQGPIELIVANDNSPDATDAVIKVFLQRTEIPRNVDIRYFRHAVNKGMVSNFIYALNQVKGKYVAICEGDDFWIDPDKLEKQITFLEDNKDYNVSTHDVYIVDENYIENKLVGSKRRTEPLLGDNISDTYTLRDYMEKEGLFHTCSFLFRANIVKTFPTFLKEVMSLDQALFILYCLGGKIHYINRPMACHLKHSGGITNSASHKNVLKSINNQLKMLTDINEYTGYKYSEILKIRINRLKLNKLKALSGLYYIKRYLFRS